MRKIVLTVIILAVGSQLLAFETSMLNLRVPSNLDGKSLLFEVQHRFRGVLTEEPIENFFGLDFGANVNFGLRYAMFRRFELNAAYTTHEGEYKVGATYAYHVPQIFLMLQVDMQYFNFERGGERNGNFFYSIAVQSYRIANFFSPVVNFGYDGYNEKFGLGVGLQAGFDWWFGPIERISLIGEYYPVLEEEEAVTGPENYFATGLRVDTDGHRFMLQISNGWNTGPRRLMLGTTTNDVYIGFNIQRLLRF
ncbi:MAG: hypothetical protein JSV53_04260 [candidate division WOR-3 bacterium]|nr:MAG: hypothetical protein JSV53_04260 [candidate division WOR-3 bacterium]